jgi:hypothetical protein
MLETRVTQVQVVYLVLGKISKDKVGAIMPLTGQHGYLAAEALDQCGFTGTIVSQQTDPITRMNIQTNVGQYRVCIAKVSLVQGE